VGPLLPSSDANHTRAGMSYAGSILSVMRGKNPAGQREDLMAGRRGGGGGRSGGGRGARKVIDVEPRPDGRWAAQTRGTKRASTVQDKKQDVVNRAVEQAKGQKPSQVVIRDQKGRIQSERTYGGDPEKSKG
jgi:hypothetical protein